MPWEEDADDPAAWMASRIFGAVDGDTSIQLFASELRAAAAKLASSPGHGTLLPPPHFGVQALLTSVESVGRDRAAARPLH